MQNVAPFTSNYVLYVYALLGEILLYIIPLSIGPLEKFQSNSSIDTVLKVKLVSNQLADIIQCSITARIYLMQVMSCSSLDKNSEELRNFLSSACLKFVGAWVSLQIIWWYEFNQLGSFWSPTWRKLWKYLSNASWPMCICSNWPPETFRMEQGSSWETQVLVNINKSSI